MKRFLWSLGIVSLLGLANCGGESSEEAKALLQKILNLVGIPHNIVVNICQDSNKNGICGLGEQKVSLVIKKGESVATIWEKILQSEDGRYLLETYNPEKPILVELQDVAKVNYDEGKFTLVFDGFETREDDNETKEISILGSMVDADAITVAEANKFRTLNNEEAQDKFYVMLLNDLETNINTLRRDGLDSTKAVKATIKEMGDETKANQAVADSINACADDQACVDREIEKVSNELIITESESAEITNKNESSQTVEPTAQPIAQSGEATPQPVAQSGEPTPQPVAQSGEEFQNGKWVKPSQSVCESNGGSYNGDCDANWENAKIICSAIGGVLPNIETLKTVITDCGGGIDDFSNNRENESYQACYKEKGFTSNIYWSSTTFVSNSSEAWAIGFDAGNLLLGSKENEPSVRCVRGGE